MGNKAKTKDIHDVIDYDGVIMTDSGGYQVLEYGSIGVEARKIAQFEIDIGSDICDTSRQTHWFRIKLSKI